MGALATIKASSEMTDGRVAVIEQLAPQGVGSPLHVHHREDEWFYVSEGHSPSGSGRADRGSRRIVCVRTPRHPAYVPCQLSGGPLPPRLRARRLRELHARGGPAGVDAHDPAACSPPSDPAPLIAAAAECGIDNPRATRHPRLKPG